MRRHRLLPSCVFSCVASSSIALAVAGLGCSKVDVGIEDKPEVPFEVHVHVTSDPGRPLLGASVLSGTKLAGKTDTAGLAKVRFGGREGEITELNVKCPADFESPDKPLSIALRRLAPGSHPPQFEVRCPPSVRTVVVGVRADNGVNLPIMYLGRPIARTDASGAAHLTLSVKPSEQVQLTLSTAEKGSEQLRPQSPTLTFVSSNHDDFVALDQKFTIEKKVSNYHPPPKPQGPTRLKDL